VPIPLNEDCWLGINGEPTDGLSAETYRQTVEDYVNDLEADGIYAILDLHWSAPGSVVPDGQRPMLDHHSVAFWTSVASSKGAARSPTRTTAPPRTRLRPTPRSGCSNWSTRSARREPRSRSCSGAWRTRTT
jgi:hypothetical protein